MHDNLKGGRLPLEVRLGSQVDIVTQMTSGHVTLTLH